MQPSKATKASFKSAQLNVVGTYGGGSSSNTVIDKIIHKGKGKKMNEKLKAYIRKLIEETQDDLNRDKDQMSKEDIYYDSGYIGALTFIVNLDELV